MTSIDDEVLMALADGELDPERAAQALAAVAEDPALAERYAIFVETRALLESDREQDLEAVPANLVAAVRAAAAREIRSGPTPLPGGATAPPAGAPQAGAASPWPIALAASIALAVGAALGIGFSRLSDRAPEGTAPLANALTSARGALSVALDTLGSGEVRSFSDAATGRSGRIAIIDTHRMGDGSVCRRAEIASDRGSDAVEVVVSCREGDGPWTPRAIVARPSAGGYAPASGPADPTDSLIEAMGAVERLAGDAERALLKRP